MIRFALYDRGRGLSKHFALRADAAQESQKTHPNE